MDLLGDEPVLLEERRHRVVDRLVHPLKPGHAAVVRVTHSVRLVEEDELRLRVLRLHRVEV